MRVLVIPFFPKFKPFANHLSPEQAPANATAPAIPCPAAFRKGFPDLESPS